LKKIGCKKTPFSAYACLNRVYELGVSQNSSFSDLRHRWSYGGTRSQPKNWKFWAHDRRE